MGSKAILYSAIGGAFVSGERANALPARRLESLGEELGRFRERDDLNGFQRWILDGLYKLDPPAGFPAASIILIAVPHPFFATVEFDYQGRSYACQSFVMSDFESAEKSLRSALPEGAGLVAAANLPLWA